MRQDERHYPKDLRSVGELLETVGEFCDTSGASPVERFSALVAIEEVFTNFVKYNTQSRNDVRVLTTFNGKALVALLEDRDVARFVPDFVNEANMDDLANAASEGGRGLFLMRRLVDTIDWNWKDGVMTVRISKTISNQG